MKRTFTMTITGEDDNPDAEVVVDFDPPIKKTEPLPESGWYRAVMIAIGAVEEMAKKSKVIKNETTPH